MKRLLTIGAAALALAACTTTAAPTVTVTADPPDRPIISDPNDADTMRDLLIRQDSSFRGIDSDTLGQAAVLVCARLDDGFSATEIGEVAMDSGFTMRQAASLVAASIVVFCPWHEGNVR